VKHADLHKDLQQLSYGMVKVRSYGQYDVNGFRFRSIKFEAAHPLATTTNTGVVTRVIDAEWWETNYYGIINKILEFNFARNKKLKVVFFDCEWLDNNSRTRQNQFSMVEVKHNEQLLGYDIFVLIHQVEQMHYLPYTCKKLSALWVVHKVNPREWLYTLADVGCHDTSVLCGEVDEVYHEEELPTSFIIEPGLGLNVLVVVANDDVHAPKKREQKATKKKVRWGGLRSRV
jgi:hypothetical protein